MASWHAGCPRSHIWTFWNYKRLMELGALLSHASMSPSLAVVWMSGHTTLGDKEAKDEGL